MNDKFWINHRTHRNYLIEYDKPWYSYDTEIDFIIRTIFELE